MLNRINNVLIGFGYLGLAVALPLYVYFIGVALDTYNLLNESTIDFFKIMPALFMYIIPITVPVMLIYSIISIFYILFGRRKNNN